MDPSNGLAPLFEARLELHEPDLVFVPSLDPDEPDCFASVVEGLITDIIKMASLIPRIDLNCGVANYEVFVTL
jgi:dynein heavy chain